MQPHQITKIAAALHFGLAAAAVFYATRIRNETSFTDVAVKELVVICGIVLLPVLSAWLGLWIARSEGSKRLVAIGQTAALVLFSVTFVAVVRSTEGMAPLLFMLVSMWIAVGLAVVLAIAWIMSRSARV